MYFKRLEILGFKSFMDKTVLNFEPGITAVVGPNGCGKSNVFDSIRWVLGEQSAKSLRGAQMEDVIFNGTDTKQPLGMAEVSLSFDNTTRLFPLDQDEVMITRRIFRSGDSEYLLNKSQVRLRDINELLMGTGIGAESYSIIAQGKIDLVLSSKPEERRQVFDEASGITKYKSQKKDALRRLEETDQNLLRVNDIITEVRRSIGYLERQANKARRYQVTFDELKNKEINLALLQKKLFLEKKKCLIDKLDYIKKQEEELVSVIAEDETRINLINENLKKSEDALRNIKSMISSLNNQISQDNQHINFNQERIKEFENTKNYLQNQISQTRERFVKEEEKLIKAKEELALMKKSLDEKIINLKENEDRIAGVVNFIDNALKSISDAKKSIIDVVSRIAQAKNNFTDLTSKQQVFLSRKKRLEMENVKLIEEKKDVQNNLNGINNEMLELEKEYQQMNDALARMKQDHEAESQNLVKISEEIESLERQRSALLSQKEFLDKLKTQYEDISESMNAYVYLDKMPQEKITGLVVRIKEYVDNPQGQDHNFSIKISGEAKPIDLDAQRVNEKIKQVEETLVILRSQKNEKEMFIKDLNTSIQESARQLQQKEVLVSSKKSVHNTITEQYNKISEEEQIILLEITDVEKEFNSLSERFVFCQNSIVELEKEHRNLEFSIHDTQEHINSKSKTKEEMLVAITQAQTEISSFNKRLATEESNYKNLEDSCNQDRKNIENMQIKLDDTTTRQTVLSEEIEELLVTIDSAKNDITQKNKLLEIEEFRNNEFIMGLGALQKEVQSKKKELDSFKDSGYEIQMADKDLEFKYQTIRDRMSQAYKFDLDSADISVLEIVQPQENIDNQAVTDDQVVQAAQDIVNNEQKAAPIELNEVVLESDISKLKEKIDSYGTVNLVAIAEYDELKKRYDFLTQQQNDLIKAKDTLQDAIRKINLTTKKIFMETFEKVREEFRNYFRILFGGGDAQVYLIDENDPLETGIEIICRPPGKKLQNVLLLSGGEKSMSAIALIFAIFKVKPAPFCILDEIDAALDEVNVDRFSRVLQEFALTSQFIVITHNKRTIANANVMYGITMQESGVSKIVSVKFSEKVKETQQDISTEAVAVE